MENKFIKINLAIIFLLFIFFAICINLVANKENITQGGYEGGNIIIDIKLLNSNGNNVINLKSTEVAEIEKWNYIGEDTYRFIDIINLLIVNDEISDKQYEIEITKNDGEIQNCIIKNDSLYLKTISNNNLSISGTFDCEEGTFTDTTDYNQIENLKEQKEKYIEKKERKEKIKDIVFYTILIIFLILIIIEIILVINKVVNGLKNRKKS